MAVIAFPLREVLNHELVNQTASGFVTSCMGPGCTFQTEAGYISLAIACKEKGFLLFKVKPKVHMQEHFGCRGFMRTAGDVCVYARTSWERLDAT